MKDILIEIIKHLPGQHDQKKHGMPRPRSMTTATIADIHKLPEDIQNSVLEIDNLAPFNKLSRFKRYELVEFNKGIDGRYAAWSGHSALVVNYDYYGGYDLVGLDGDKRGKIAHLTSMHGGSSLVHPAQGSLKDLGNEVDVKDIDNSPSALEVSIAKRLSAITGRSYESELKQAMNAIRRGGDWRADYRSMTDWVAAGGDAKLVKDILAQRLSEEDMEKNRSWDWSSIYNPNVGLNRYVRVGRRGWRDPILGLPKDAPVVPKVTRNPEYEGNLGLTNAVNIYLGGSQVSDALLNKPLPNKLTLEYLKEVGVGRQDDNGRDMTISPTAWYLHKYKDIDLQAVNFPPHKVLSWPITQWISTKLSNPSMHRNRIINRHGHEANIQYTYMDMIDELEDEDVAAGPNTSPDRVFARAVAKRIADYERRDAWEAAHPAVGNGWADPAPLQLPGDFRFPEALPGTDHVKQLMTPQELVDEGVSMQHCVGGYQSAAARGSTVIYGIHVGDERATMEVSPPMSYNDVSSGYKIWQLRGPRNKLPTKAVEKEVLKWAKANNVDTSVVLTQSVNFFTDKDRPGQLFVFNDEGKIVPFDPDND